MKINLFDFIKLPIVLMSLFVNINGVAREFVALDAHVHGLSEITIAIDNNTVEINFSSPASNLIGFEHIATTKAQIAAVEAAELLLKQHKTIFELSGGECELENKTIDLSNLKSTQPIKKAHIDESQYKGDHPHKHIEKNNENSRHSEVIANYHYHCEKLPNLPSITVTIFKLFPGIQKIQAVWLTKIQQGTVALSAKSNVINLH